MTEFTSPMQKMQYEALVEFIEKRNALVAKVNASTGDRKSLAENLKHSEEFASIVNEIERLTTQLNEAVEAKVEAALANASEDTTETQEQIKDIDGTLRSGLSYYKKLYGEEAAEALPKQERIKTTRTGGGGSTGGKRIRGYNVIVTIGNEVTEFENFSAAAKFLDVVDTAALQEQFFAKAGVEKLKDAPDEVVFSLSWQEEDEEGNRTDVTAVVKAYRTGPSGVPTKDDADEAVEVDEDDLESI